MKKWLILTILSLLSLQAQAFEEVVVSSNAKLTDIKIKDNSIINVYPLVTIMNEKNTLFFEPLGIGNTEVCILKDEKNLVVFNVEVKEDETIVECAEEFDVLAIDLPHELTLDLPPENIGEAK